MIEPAAVVAKKNLENPRYLRANAVIRRREQGELPQRSVDLSSESVVFLATSFDE